MDPSYSRRPKCLASDVAVGAIGTLGTDAVVAAGEDRDVEPDPSRLAERSAATKELPGRPETKNISAAGGNSGASGPGPGLLSLSEKR